MYIHFRVFLNERGNRYFRKARKECWQILQANPLLSSTKTKKIEKWKNNHLFYGDGIRESVDDPQKKTAFFQEKYESLIKVDRTDLYLGLRIFSFCITDLFISTDSKMNSSGKITEIIFFSKWSVLVTKRFSKKIQKDCTDVFNKTKNVLWKYSDLLSILWSCCGNLFISFLFSQKI